VAIQVLRFLVGAALLILGRQLYWLFVAGVGFVVAMDLVPRLVQVESTALILALALVAGVVGALLAVFLQRVSIGIAGFFAGAYAALALLDALQVQTPVVWWVLALVGAAIGVGLTLVLFEWALIILSALVGAWMVPTSFSLGSGVTWLAFMVLLVIGVAVQAVMMPEGEPAARTS